LLYLCNTVHWLTDSRGPYIVCTDSIVGDLIMKKGFTLIELLIVVAIIAILAAIAVPNFLEAQTRAKVSRQKADMRTVSTALETYRIDHTKLPPDGQSTSGNAVHAGTKLSYFGVAHLNHMLTTPIAYLTTVENGDSFAKKNAPLTERTLRYVNFKNTYAELLNSPGTYTSYAKYAGDHQVSSMGPDSTASPDDLAVPGLFWIATPYDATNGTVSKGDVIRSQKNPDGYSY